MLKKLSGCCNKENPPDISTKSDDLLDIFNAMFINVRSGLSLILHEHTWNKNSDFKELKMLEAYATSRWLHKTKKLFK
jgi:hypothetical protein